MKTGEALVAPELGCKPSIEIHIQIYTKQNIDFSYTAAALLIAAYINCYHFQGDCMQCLLPVISIFWRFWRFWRYTIVHCGYNELSIYYLTFSNSSHKMASYFCCSQLAVKKQKREEETAVICMKDYQTRLETITRIVVVDWLIRVVLQNSNLIYRRFLVQWTVTKRNRL